jgi:sugar phosphate isomerase/epimerase
LTGGTNYYSGYEDDISELREQYGLNYLVHNYFPPPEQPFMLNLASTDDLTYENSIQHCRKAIDLCKRLSCDKYGVHAGFLMDFSAAEAGKKIDYRELSNRGEALQRFFNAWNSLLEYAADNVKLYIENNVLSLTNANTYKNENPFLLTDYSTYIELNEHINFNLLLDLAHLKVSTNSLGLDFQEEAIKMMALTDYIHISENDGLHDLNFGLSEDNAILKVLNNFDLNEKTMTLEVYDGIPSVLKSIENLTELIK